jgi:octaprenyl-diphosphate synthase
MTATVLSIAEKSRVRADLLEAIADEIAVVDEELHRQVGSQVDLVQKVGRHTLKAGGKRLRPALVGLAAKATGLPFDVERSRKLGACMEMIHMATLIHDDVVDNSATRRGRPTAAVEFGNTASILSGDVLLAKAMLLLAQDGDLEIIRCVSEAVVDLAEGEVRELELRGEFDLEEDTHLEVLRLKTATFIAACCEVGAIVAGAPAPVREALSEYGNQIGLAFQIVDDLLDYRGDKAKTGKPIAIDFREGQATLPLIYLREHLSEAEGSVARRKFGGSVNDDEVRLIADWMDTRGAFRRAEQRAMHHIKTAISALAPLPESDSRTLLESVAEYVFRRQA